MIVVVVRGGGKGGVEGYFRSSESPASPKVWCRERGERASNLYL